MQKRLCLLHLIALEAFLFDQDCLQRLCFIRAGMAEIVLVIFEELIGLFVNLALRTVHEVKDWIQKVIFLIEDVIGDIW